MHRRLFGWIAVCLAVAGAAGGADAASRARPEQEVATLMEHLEVAINAKDIDGVMEAYVPDDSLFLFDMIPPRQIVGFAAMRRHWERDFFAKVDGRLDYTVADLVITVDRSIGYSHSIQRLRCKDAGGRVVDITMRFTDVYRKIGKRWYIVMEHVSIPVDPNTGIPDFTSRP